MSILTAKKPKPPLVKDIMSKKIIAVGLDYTVLAVAKTLSKHQISSVPVLDKENIIVGFISIKDCLSCLINCTFHDEYKNKTSLDIMSKNVKSISDHADLFELEKFFVLQDLRHSPVVNDQGVLVGMISRKDALIAAEKIYEGAWQYKEEIKEPIHLSHYEHMKYMVKNYKL